MNHAPCKIPMCPAFQGAAGTISRRSKGFLTSQIPSPTHSMQHFWTISSPPHIQTRFRWNAKEDSFRPRLVLRTSVLSVRQIAHLTCKVGPAFQRSVNLRFRGLKMSLVMPQLVDLLALTNPLSCSATHNLLRFARREMLPEIDSDVRNRSICNFESRAWVQISGRTKAEASHCTTCRV